jgi:hypothetical protein
MDDKGYAFTPLAFLLFIPIIIVAISFSGIVNEVSTLSAIAIGGDVTSSVAANVVKTIKEDTADAGRNSAYLASRNVIDNYNGNNNPYFGTASPNDSRSFILSRTLTLLNQNVTNTCRSLEQQTGRTIIINGFTIDPAGTGSVNIFNSGNLAITQSDPFGFNITITSVPVTIKQNSTTNNQSFVFNTPPMNVYISIERLEDPYIWVNTGGHNSSVINKYPYYTQISSLVGPVNASQVYHFGDSAIIWNQPSVGTVANLNYLNASLVGPNATSFGYMPYYFPDTHGLSFFDRLENRTNGTSSSPTNARMSTFILWNPNYENIPGYTPSYLDHEYFAGINGTKISVTHSGSTLDVTDPIGNTFYISNEYKGILGLFNSYSY